MFKQNESNRYDIEWFIKHLDEYEAAYFGNPGATKIMVRNAITREFEDDEIVDKRLRKGIIDSTVVAWKAGRLSDRVIDVEKEKIILNGYGKPIDISELIRYINRIDDEKNRLNLSPAKTGTILAYIEQFSECYKVLSKVCAPVPRYMGAVYIINLLFFLSKGNFPIYDKFAHMSLKALSLGVPPCYTYIGATPDKGDIKRVKSMYLDYVNLIDSLIGLEIYGRDRKWDRALWAYGHASKLIG
jgi:hypothetical protein